MQSHNISARQIRLDADARRQAAAAAAAQQDDQDEAGPSTPNAAAAAAATTPAGDSTPNPPAEEPDDDAVQVETARAKRKREQATAIEKIKAGKNKRKRKGGDDDDDDVALAINRLAPLPGQMENCALCRKRFTVTAYSRAGPDGGLLCSPCGKELDKNEKSAAGKGKAPARRGGARRKVQSKILDGTYRVGAKSLMTLCIQTLANNIHLADDLGELPDFVMDKIARELSRRRLVDSKTLNLFLHPSTDTLRVYDGAKLQGGDIVRIFQTLPLLKHLKIRNAIQFKDGVMEYLISRDIELESLYLHGSNLISQQVWIMFLESKGASLKSLRVYYMDKYFDDEVVSAIPKHAPGLKRLKIEHNHKVSQDSVKKLGDLRGLEHLSLRLQNHVHPDVFVSLLSKLGPGLRTLSLTLVPKADNTVLDAIHTHCRSLKKLRITESEVMTDEGFVRLFEGWQNNPLLFIDLQKCRHISDQETRHNADNPDKVGLGPEGFKALMAHSGQHLKQLNVHGCRHITAEAFEEVFGPDKLYPTITNMEISFCDKVTDFIVGSIFRCCPSLKSLNVFGCMKVKDVRVPRGKILVGVPTAAGMVIEGQ